jgi:hypothetical protein
VGLTGLPKAVATFITNTAETRRINLIDFIIDNLD